VAVEEPDGTMTYGEDPFDPYLTIKRDLATGQLAIRLRGNDADVWYELEVDPEGKPNLYWLHYTLELPPCPPGPVRFADSVLAALWDDPSIVRRLDGTGVLTHISPLVFQLDGDVLRLADGHDFPNLWPLPELAAKTKRSGASYHERVNGKR
jgi:hypothetical protein